MTDLNRAALDRWITGNDGDDQYRDHSGEHPQACRCPECDPDLARDQAYDREALPEEPYR